MRPCVSAASFWRASMFWTPFSNKVLELMRMAVA
jgi:hypothetical protein